MRVKSFLVVLVILTIILSACESVDVLNKSAQNLKSLQSGGAAGGAVDFRQGEVLSSNSEGSSMTDPEYKVAAVLTAPSAATKNQAEVLFASGDKKWVTYTVPSHKASENELKLADYVLFMPYYSDDETVSQESYRSSGWRFGRITSLDELFKGMVEIEGEPNYVKWIRVPDVPVE